MYSSLSSVVRPGQSLLRPHHSSGLHCLNAEVGQQVLPGLPKCLHKAGASESEISECSMERIAMKPATPFREEKGTDLYSSDEL